MEMPAELGAAAALDPRDVTLTVRALEDRGIVSRAKDRAMGAGRWCHSPMRVAGSRRASGARW